MIFKKIPSNQYFFWSHLHRFIISFIIALRWLLKQSLIMEKVFFKEVYKIKESNYLVQIQGFPIWKLTKANQYFNYCDHHHNTVFLVVLTKFSFCLSFTHFVFKSWQVLSAEFELGLQAMIENVHFKNQKNYR